MSAYMSDAERVLMHIHSIPWDQHLFVGPYETTVYGIMYGLNMTRVKTKTALEQLENDHKITSSKIRTVKDGEILTNKVRCYGITDAGSKAANEIEMKMKREKE